MTNSNIVPLLTPNARLKEIPLAVARLILGAEVINPWRGHKDIFVIDGITGSKMFHSDDFSIIQSIAKRVTKELGLGLVVSHHKVLEIVDRAQDIVNSLQDDRNGKKGVVMLKDNGGCGYWRMILPAKFMDESGVYVDVSGAAMNLNALLEYHTIYVQRLHDWESYSLLVRLKNAGKRIIYDLDDDIFNIPKSNPAFEAFGCGEQTAAIECMKLADVVTTTTMVLQERLTVHLNGIVPMIIPNSIDTGGWVPTPFTGSLDGIKRIFWQGSSTHNEDWNECFDAVERIMKSRKDVHLTLLGFIPTCLREHMNESHFQGKIEYLGPMNPEAYFRLIRDVHADVGLAPLKQDFFNMAKSNIKWIENSMIGMPTVASDVYPYSDVIEHGVTGFIANTSKEWEDYILQCLDDVVIRRGIIVKARDRIENEFNIRFAASQWKRILLGGSGSSDSDF
jgi:glycosyltransferase involved in cell wall biosynthesis